MEVVQLYCGAFPEFNLAFNQFQNITPTDNELSNLIPGPMSKCEENLRNHRSSKFRKQIRSVCPQGSGGGGGNEGNKGNNGRKLLFALHNMFIFLIKYENTECPIGVCILQIWVTFEQTTNNEESLLVRILVIEYC